MTAFRSGIAGVTAAAAGYLHATIPLPPSLLRGVAGTLLAGVAILAVVTSSGSTGGRHTKPRATRNGHPALALGGYVLAGLLGIASLAGPQILLLTIILVALVTLVVSVIVHRSPVRSV
jgi:hypothetical protein